MADLSDFGCFHDFVINSLRVVIKFMSFINTFHDFVITYVENFVGNQKYKIYNQIIYVIPR